MRRPSYHRAAQRRGPDRRIIAAVAVLVAFGGVIGVTQISNADESKTVACQAPAADPAAPSGKKAASDPKVGTYTDKDGDVQHKGDGQLAKGEKAPEAQPVEECKTGNTTAKQVNGLTILANSCEDSDLQPHDGFQLGNRCVSTEFGEVGEAAKNPTLLITEFPETVKANTPFTLKVSTRNLVRDRFLAAGQGGYYVESSVLTAEGLVRGHFHTACRMLASTSEAVDPAPVPAFFVATEDKKGGADPDTVTIQVPGLPQEGIAQCASWAGDGSHRIPMMQRANQTPALDAVRVKVEGGQAEEPPAEEPENPPATTPPADNGGGDNNGGNNGGDNNGGGDNDNGNGNGGDNGQGDNGNNPNPGATATPKTDAGNTPPKTGTVTIPPKNDASAPKPAKTTKPAASTGDEATNDNNGDTGNGGDEATKDDEDAESPVQAVAGKTAKPTKKATKEPAAEVVTNTDDGAPDAQQAAAETTDVQAENKSKLALTGANSVTIILGGALLVLSGLVLVGATRRRRAAARD
ncbi:hypothetical protein [Actinoplanes friuliensis]|uniref:Uncharacterized protein n=1 Tax=Actinoplanes friuliensis DSM 7358 TaxID=1246995 RepID=U5W3D6_9ACTN|nr:hypothetical protein [Actinoplanes friuliensis]AGZ42446.1 hypothetical protein AFR_20870 [Actinoplanes friuliensis DSM 7358]